VPSARRGKRISWATIRPARRLAIEATMIV
jgi:hypothetical protein